MKKIVLTLSLIFAAFTMVAQDNIAVFVYSVSKLNEPINALRSSMVGALVNSVEGKYKVVDRSTEFAKILNMEFGYQEQGFVSDNQLIDAGKQVGANKVCGVVITDYGQDGGGYQIECNIIDIESSTVEKHADYPNQQNELIYKLDILNSRKIATSLSKQLFNNQTNQDNNQVNQEETKFPTFKYKGTTYMVAPEPDFVMTQKMAKSYCENLTLEGHSDWILPDKNQLLMMCSEKKEIGLSGNYWASDSYSYLNSSSCDISSSYNSNDKYHVRPIRPIRRKTKYVYEYGHCGIVPSE